MIWLFSGTPGSGKSLYAAYYLIGELKRKHDIIANFPINMEYFEDKKKRLTNFTFISHGKIKRRLGKYIYLDNSELSVNWLVEYAKEHHVMGKEHQTTIIIDECSVMFNARAWDAKGRMEWIIFFQQHRKLGFDVILISQHDRMIDKQIRAFIETEYKFRAMKNYKMFGYILSFLCGGLFAKVEYWYGTRLRCGSEFFLFNKNKARVYDTFQIFSAGAPPGRETGGRGTPVEGPDVAPHYT